MIEFGKFKIDFDGLMIILLIVGVICLSTTAIVINIFGGG